MATSAAVNLLDGPVECPYGQATELDVRRQNSGGWFIVLELGGVALGLLEVADELGLVHHAGQAS